MKKILLIVENHEPEAILQGLFEDKSEYRIYHVKNSVEGRFKATNEKMDLICLDYVSQGGVSGAELLLNIRQTQYNGYTPVCVFFEENDQRADIDVEREQLYYFKLPLDKKKFLDRTRSLLNSNNTKSPISRETKFLNIFITSILHTMRTLAGLRAIRPGKGVLVKEGRIVNSTDINGVIAIQSDSVDGTLILSFPSAFFLKLTTVIFNEDQFEINEKSLDAAAEITNIILGLSKRDLSLIGYKLNKAIPKIVNAEELALIQPKHIPSIVIPFSTEVGDFDVRISIKYAHS